MLEIGDLQGARWRQVEVLADTGSSLTTVPGEILDDLGIERARRQRFRLANGQVVENDVGDARVRLMGQEATTAVIFGEPGEPALLGAVTLETLLLAVDPVHETLVPIVGLRVSRLPL